MSHADQLIEIATELAMDAKDDVADLQRKLSAIETAKVEKESRLHIANDALERLSSFVSMRGSDLQCPRCWITSEVIASLQLSNGNGDHVTSFDARSAKAFSICKFKYAARLLRVQTTTAVAQEVLVDILPHETRSNSHCRCSHNSCSSDG